MSSPEESDAHESQVHATGEVIAGKYKLLRRLGEGGTGSVWAARNLVLDVDVALKLLHQGTATPELVARLLIEARATSRLGHRSIVRVFDLGTTDGGEPFLVMEVLEGRSLARTLDEDGPLSPTGAVSVLLPIADALSAAHARGIFHCDVKSDNVMLAREGRGRIVPKLVDFGIASFVAGASGRQVNLGAQGSITGTPDYMSPEQARGDVLDARTDVWSLGVVLYEAITGTLPFKGPSVTAVLSAVLTNEPEPLCTYGIEDAALAEILGRALAKDRSARWASMASFGFALAAWAYARGEVTDVCGMSLEEQWLDAEGPRSSRLRSAPSLDRVSMPAIERESTSPMPLAVRRPVDSDALSEARSEARPQLAPDASTTGPLPDPASAAVLARQASPSRETLTPHDTSADRRSDEVFVPRRRRARWPYVAVLSAAASAIALADPGVVAAVSAIDPRVASAVLPVASIVASGRQWIGAGIASATVATGDAVSAAAEVASATPAATLASSPSAAPTSTPLGAAAPAETAAPTSATVTAGAPAGTATSATTQARDAAATNACVAAMLPPGSFHGGAADLGAVCSERDPRRGAGLVHAELVRSGYAQPPTQGMLEWAMLRWYELAFVAVARAECCPGERIELPEAPAGCEPLAKVLDDLGNATAASADVEPHLARYAAAVHCTVSKGGAQAYRYDGRPRGGEETTFRKTLARAVAHATPSSTR
jgi:serine/threonine-protein kinase